MYYINYIIRILYNLIYLNAMSIQEILFHSILLCSHLILTNNFSTRFLFQKLPQYKSFQKINCFFHTN